VKIAVPTLDGSYISTHFGRAPAFVIFTAESGRVVEREVRANPFADPRFHRHGTPRDAESDPHAGVARVLADVDVLLTYGGRACDGYAGLAARGVEIVSLFEDGVVDEAVESYLARRLG
jgi:predicted Fe-Mo cluster-binding NifX family protein